MWADGQRWLKDDRLVGGTDGGAWGGDCAGTQAINGEGSQPSERRGCAVDGAAPALPGAPRSRVWGHDLSPLMWQSLHSVQQGEGAAVGPPFPPTRERGGLQDPPAARGQKLWFLFAFKFPSSRKLLRQGAGGAAS